MDFIGNKPIIWTNQNNKINLFTPVINKLTTNISLNVTNQTLSNNEVKLQLYKNSKLISTTTNSGNNFVFNNITFDNEETNNYELKILSQNYKLDNNTLKITTTYNPYSNSLSINYNKNITLTKIVKTNTTINKKEEQKNTTTTVEQDNNKTNTTTTTKQETNTKTITNKDTTSTITKEEKTKENKENKESEPIIKQQEETNSTKEEKIPVTNTNESNENNIVVTEVKVPNTKSNASLSILGLISILISIVLVKSKVNTLR